MVLIVFLAHLPNGIIFLFITPGLCGVSQVLRSGRGLLIILGGKKNLKWRILFIADIVSGSCVQVVQCCGYLNNVF